MKERTKLLLEWERRWQEAEGGPVNMSELCRMFGVSRQSGYKWVTRYREAKHDLSAAAEQSRRPINSPHALSAEVQDLIVAARKRWPKWGPRKLRRKIEEANPGQWVPSASVIAKVLSQRGMTVPRRRRAKSTTPAVSVPFAGCDASNAVWCIDFKGWFLTRDGRRCYPLTLLDAFSRYLLRCEGLIDPDGASVQSVLDSAFQEFGRPAAIRSDGGPPFASRGPALLTKLSIWLLQLGIRVEVIAPGKPQQNGRLERLHRTLKAETAMPAERDICTQQRRFDVWRREYNVERPHESLGMKAPATVYVKSRRTYPCRLITVTREPFSDVVQVDKQGFIRWRRRKVFVSSVLRHEYLELDNDPSGRWDVRWGAILLGRLDEARPDRGLIATRRPRGMVTLDLSAMSVG